MKKVGRRVYYDTDTGNIILITSESEGNAFETTIDQDIQDFTALSERNRESFDVIQLEYGQYAQDFTECNGFRVNIETKTLEFSYPDPNQEQPQEHLYQKPLSEEVEDLKAQVAQTDELVLSLIETIYL